MIERLILGYRLRLLIHYLAEPLDVGLTAGHGERRLQLPLEFGLLLLQNLVLLLQDPSLHLLALHLLLQLLKLRLPVVLLLLYVLLEYQRLFLVLLLERDVRVIGELLDRRDLALCALAGIH